MKKRALYILGLMLLAPVQSGAETLLNGEIQTNIPHSAIVEALPNEKNNTTINAKYGTHNGLRADFSIKTNADDSIFDFVISSKVPTQNGDRNAYVLNNNILYILLGNSENPPSSSDYNDIASGTLAENANIIAYPVSNISELTVTPQIYDGELCCKFLAEGNQNMSVSQYIGGTPLNNTYSMINDTKGIYKTTLTLNVYPKP